MSADLLLARESMIPVPLAVCPIALVMCLPSAHMFGGKMSREIVCITESEPTVLPSTYRILLLFIWRGNRFAASDNRR